MTIITTTIERQEDRIVVKRPGTEGAKHLMALLAVEDVHPTQKIVRADWVMEALREVYAMGRSDARLEVSAVLRGLMGQ